MTTDFVRVCAAVGAGGLLPACTPDLHDQLEARCFQAGWAEDCLVDLAEVWQATAWDRVVFLPAGTDRAESLRAAGLRAYLNPTHGAVLFVDRGLATHVVWGRGTDNRDLVMFRVFPPDAPTVDLDTSALVADLRAFSRDEARFRVRALGEGQAAPIVLVPFEEARQK